MKRAFVAAAVWLLTATPLLAQQNVPVYATGPLTPGHALALQQTGTPGSSVVRDAGPALAGNFTEIGITGPGTPLCVREGTSNYHLLCLGANALGGGLISYNPVGSAPLLPLQFNINGTTYPFTSAGGGNIVGPGSSAVGDIATFNNTIGTLLAGSAAGASFQTTLTFGTPVIDGVLPPGTSSWTNSILRLGQALSNVSGTDQDQFLINLQATVPVTNSTIGYERAMLLTWCKTADPSQYTPTEIDRDCVGADLRAWAYNGNTRGRLWGGYFEVRFLAGTDGYSQAVDAISFNTGGSDQPLNDTSTSKYGVIIHSVNGALTTAVRTASAGSPLGTFHHGFWMTENNFVGLNTGAVPFDDFLHLDNNSNGNGWTSCLYCVTYNGNTITAGYFLSSYQGTLPTLVPGDALVMANATAGALLIGMGGAGGADVTIANSGGNPAAHIPTGTQIFQIDSVLLTPGAFLTSATTVATGTQIGLGTTTVAAGSGTCPTGTVGGQTVAGCWTINVKGTNRNFPFF